MTGLSDHVGRNAHLTGAREYALPLLIANGVMGVRDMGGDFDYLSQLRGDIAEGKSLGPRIILAGPFVDGPKPGAMNRLTVTSADEARKAVDRLKDRGVDFIKVHSAISRDAYFALAAEAKGKSIPFVGHVPDAITAAEASDAGQATIEHLLPVDEMLGSGSDALFQRLARNHTWEVPTLVSWRPYAFPSDPNLANDPRQRYLPRSVFEDWDRNQPVQNLSPEVLANRKRIWPSVVNVVGRMQRAGVQLMAGTDFSVRYVYPGFSLHDELELLVQGGLTPMQALQTATRNPARFLGIEATTGTVEVGKSADLIVLDADPLKDIRNTQKIWAVVVGGTCVRRDALDKMLKDVQAAVVRN